MSTPTPPFASEPFVLSTHAQLRVLERTSISVGHVLEYLSRGVAVWLPWRGPGDVWYALFYSALQDAFFIAVVDPDRPVLITVLTVEQFEERRRPLAPVWRVLARTAASQALAQPALPGAAAGAAPACVVPSRSSHDTFFGPPLPPVRVDFVLNNPQGSEHLRLGQSRLGTLTVPAMERMLGRPITLQGHVSRRLQGLVECGPFKWWLCQRMAGREADLAHCGLLVVAHLPRNVVTRDLTAVMHALLQDPPTFEEPEAPAELPSPALVLRGAPVPPDFIGPPAPLPRATLFLCTPGPEAGSDVDMPQTFVGTLAPQKLRELGVKLQLSKPRYVHGAIKYLPHLPAFQAWLLERLAPHVNELTDACRLLARIEHEEGGASATLDLTRELQKMLSAGPRHDDIVFETGLLVRTRPSAAEPLREVTPPPPDTGELNDQAGPAEAAVAPPASTRPRWDLREVLFGHGATQAPPPAAPRPQELGCPGPARRAPADDAQEAQASQPQLPAGDTRA